MVNAKKGKSRLNAYIISDEYPEYVLLEIKRRLDHLYFSMLVLQKAGASKKTAASILAPFRKVLGTLLDTISYDAKKTISKINSLKPDVIVYERHPKIRGLDLAQAESIIRKEMSNITEMEKIDGKFAKSVSRLLGIYQGYYLGMVSQAPDPKVAPNYVDTDEFMELVNCSAPKAKRIVLVTHRQDLSKYIAALKANSFAVRTYSFAELKRILAEEKMLMKMSRLSWLKKSAIKAGVKGKTVEGEFLRLAKLFGVSRL
jgi:hypothetical protein